MNYDNMNYEDMNDFLTKIYMCTKHFFKYIDKDILFSKESSGSENVRRLITNNMSFTYGVTLNPSKIINRDGDIVAGLYFPHQNIGDKINISIGPECVSTLYISDINKIYFPLYDDDFIFSICLSGHEIHVNTNIPYYVVSIYFNRKERRSLVANDCSIKIHKLDKILTYNYGMAHLYDDNGHMNIYNYSRNGYVKNIQKYWKTYKENKLKYLDKWKNNIIEVNKEIEYMPEFGIEYFKHKNNFNKLKII